MNHKKQIAFIGVKGIPANFKGVGGIETRVESLAKELVKLGFGVKVFVRNWATPKYLKEYQGVKLIHLPTINTKHADAFIHSLLASFYVCFTKDQVICYEAMGPALFCFLPKLFGKRVVTTIHCLDWQRDKWGTLAKLFLRLAEGIAVIFSDQIVVVSSELQDYYFKQDLETFLLPSALVMHGRIAPKLIQHKYGLNKDNFILYLGRFVPEKRIEWLIKAYKKIKTKKKLIIAGGSSHSQNYVTKLFNLAKSNSRIIFTGYVFGREKEELLANCFLFVQPSKIEGSSISLIEAIEYHRPVLVADIAANQELIDSQNFLFQNNDFMDFSRKLTNLIKRKKIIFKIKKDLLKKSWRQIAWKFTEAF